MTLILVVAFSLAMAGVYAAYRDPKLGAALMVGLTIIMVLYVIWEKDPTVFETDSPPPSTVPAQVVPPDVSSPPPVDLSPTTSPQSSPPL